MIRAREVRLVGTDGQQLGITSLDQALATARRQDLDLVEVAPQASPPVCRIMDYGKFKFDSGHRSRDGRRRSTASAIKEMKYRPKIGPGDFETKTRQVHKFLDQGHKVKVTIMFRGREVFHPELGKRILDRVAEHVQDIAKVETEARLDGRNMVMVLAPARRPTVPRTTVPGQAGGAQEAGGAGQAAASSAAAGPGAPSAALPGPGAPSANGEGAPVPQAGAAAQEAGTGARQATAPGVGPAEAAGS